MTIRAAIQLKRPGFLLESVHVDGGPWEIDTHGITVLYGPSGAGKTSLLRTIAGLEPQAQGELYFRETCWQNEQIFVAADKRRVGFVFQDAALFPHLTVHGNLQYAAKRCQHAAQAHVEIPQIAKRVGIENLLERPVTALSGGEKQRVAIARALLSCPQLLCMDEPLSALDWRSRNALLALIEKLALETQIPVLYVTHTPREVERLATRIVFMEKGRIQSCESLQQALRQPDSPLFDEEGPASVLEGMLHAADADGLQRFSSQGGVLFQLAQKSRTNPSASRLRVLAKDVSLALVDPQDISILNHVPATVSALSPTRDGRVIVQLRLTDEEYLFSEITAFSANKLKLHIDQQVFALIKSVALFD